MYIHIHIKYDVYIYIHTEPSSPFKLRRIPTYNPLVRSFDHGSAEDAIIQFRLHPDSHPWFAQRGTPNLGVLVMDVSSDSSLCAP